MIFFNTELYYCVSYISAQHHFTRLNKKYVIFNTKNALTVKSLVLSNVNYTNSHSCKKGGKKKK